MDRRALEGALQSFGLLADSADTTSRDEFRMHLGHIARAFKNGDFDIPMKRIQKEIQYTFEETASGGRVIISSTDKEAVSAIHSFLRFQIDEHKTGDPMEIR
jgi:hypothetical protein